MTNYKQPFDNRLVVHINTQKTTSNDSFLDYQPHIPMSGKASTNVYSFLMSLDTLIEKKEKYNTGKEGAPTMDDFEKLFDYQQEAIDIASKNPKNFVQNSLMNPYAALHLTNGLNEDGTTKLIDRSDKRRWYENDNIKTNIITDETEQTLLHYSKYPTTAALIEWGNQDPKKRTPYLFQDFVFSKWWNKIPNNRLITLRRYPNPVLDNLNTPSDGIVSYTYNESKKALEIGEVEKTDDKGKVIRDKKGNVEKTKATHSFSNNGVASATPEDLKYFSPLSTAITYFGEETGNNLKDILKFSTSVKWTETKADVWDLTYTQTPPNNNEAISGGLGAIGFQYGGEIAKALNALSIWDGTGGMSGGTVEKNGLPPDPYREGPYSNRIMGPVNRIDAVKRRDAGINFEMSGLKIKFNYLARPIGGINSKAVMLDILANFMALGSASAVFFGGAHRFRLPGRRFPANKDSFTRHLYNGDLLGGIKSIGTRLTNFLDANGGVIGVLNIMANAAMEIFNNVMGAFGISPNLDTTKEGKDLAQNIQGALGEKIKSGMTVPYIQNMRALLTGEPVGEWHLTIGNPMNPIAMIGNLICTNLEVEIDEEAGLGPDDFPLGWTITVTLDHGMARDRDAIESMFNFGNGRIYELSDAFVSSAQKETKIDAGSGHKYNYTKKGAQLKGYVGDNVLSRNEQNTKKVLEMKENRINSVGFSNLSEIGQRTPRIAITDFAVKKIGK